MAVKRKTKKKAKKMDIVKAGRSKAYHYAIEYCDKLKTLYEKTGQKKEWKKLITFVYRFDGRVAASVSRATFYYSSLGLRHSFLILVS